MSMMAASRVTLKSSLTDEQVEETVGKIREITGRFNLQARGNPPQMILNGVSAQSQTAVKIRQVPGVQSVNHQF
jgi:hypothetical protein